MRFFFCIYSFTFKRNEKKSETPDRMRQKLMISGKKCKHTKTARIKTEVTKIVCFRVRVRCCVCTHLRWCIQKCVSFRSAVQNDLESPIPECKNDNFMIMNKKTNESKNKQITTVTSGKFNKNMCARIEKQSHSCKVHTHEAMRRTLNLLTMRAAESQVYGINTQNSIFIID